MNLLNTTRQLLKNRPRAMTLQKISRETDLKMSWVVSMAGASPPRDPGVNMVERLYSYLSGKGLELVSHANGHTERTTES